MADAAEITAFTLQDQTVPVAEVIRAAHYRGELEPHWQTVLRKRAALQLALSDELEPNVEALQALADRFRYDRDLITSEETEAWLAKRCLSSDDFTAYLQRTYWGEQLGHRIEPSTDELRLTDPDQQHAVITELFLNGGFTGLARRLAWRMACRGTAASSGQESAAEVEKQAADFLERTELGPDQVTGWLESTGADAAWLVAMNELEAGFETETTTLVTPERLARALRSQRLALTKLVVEEIEFDTMEAAREAMLCVKEDNLSMQEIANESGYPYYEREYLLEELPSEWQVPLLSTPENALAGPFVEDDLVRVFRMRSKADPALEDEAVHERLQESLVASHFSELCAAQGLKSLWIR